MEAGAKLRKLARVDQVLVAVWGQQLQSLWSGYPAGHCRSCGRILFLCSWSHHCPFVCSASQCKCPLGGPEGAAGAGGLKASGLVRFGDGPGQVACEAQHWEATALTELPTESQPGSTSPSDPRPKQSLNTAQTPSCNLCVCTRLAADV